MQAKGAFDVKTARLKERALKQKRGVARMTIDKTWRGDLSGKSGGVMLTSQTESTGAMAYVALEKVEATINGKKGVFYFSHVASMKKSYPGSSILKIEVVPNSGTDELAGISGQMSIGIDEKGNHSYVFDYKLPFA